MRDDTTRQTPSNVTSFDAAKRRKAGAAPGKKRGLDDNRGRRKPLSTERIKHPEVPAQVLNQNSSKSPERIRLIGRAALPKNDPDDPIALGREALKRLKANYRQNWEDFKMLGRAFLKGREEVLTKVGGKVGNKAYNMRYGEWLRLNELDGFLDKSDRSKLIALVENLEKVEAWRASLTEAERSRYNHPSTLWRAWRCPRRGQRWANNNRARPEVEPGNISIASIAPRNDADDDDAPTVLKLNLSTASGVLIAANRLAGVAVDMREFLRKFSGDIEEAVALAVREVADEFRNTADAFEKLRKCETELAQTAPEPEPVS
jgi:hypothetical protein